MFHLKTERDEVKPGFNFDFNNGIMFILCFSRDEEKYGKYIQRETYHIGFRWSNVRKRFFNMTERSYQLIPLKDV